MYGLPVMAVTSTSTLANGVMSVIPAYIVAIRMKMLMPDIAYLMLLVGIVLGRLISVWLDKKR